MSEIFNLETKTLWSFKQRGNWASRKGDYPGNWSPFVPKNIILRYSKEEDLILDQFLGSGTTLIEAKLLNRIGIGCDVNPRSIILSQNRINRINGNKNIKIVKCDAKNLYFIKNETVDLICTHPPYSNIIKYSKSINEDISLLCIEEFYKSMELVAKEAFRVLKKAKICVFMMGDIRENGCVIPLGFNVMNIFLNQGFKIKEIIIKEQHNCSSTEYWKSISLKRNFYILAHEYIFVLFK